MRLVKRNECRPRRNSLSSIYNSNYSFLNFLSLYPLFKRGYIAYFLLFLHTCVLLADYESKQNFYSTESTILHWKLPSGESNRMLISWWSICESGDHEDSQTAQGIYGTVWRNAERWKKSHNDRHLYDELISYADLYDSTSFEAKKMIVNQLIRRVDVYRGYQINISFNFDLTPYIEGEWYVRLQNSRASNKHFQKQRNSKNWGLPSMRLQNQAFGWFSM